MAVKGFMNTFVTSLMIAETAMKRGIFSQLLLQ